MEISILQWNIWFHEDLAKVAAWLREHPVDVVCLQEMTIGAPWQEIADGPTYLAEQLGYEAHCKELPIELTGGRKIMLADGVFSRFPMVERLHMFINEPKGGGGYDDEYRVYVEAVLDVGGKRVSVGTTHMSYTDRFVETPHKRVEADALVGALKKRPERHIFTGDLNVGPDSYTIGEIEKLMRHAGPDYGEKTWTTKPFSYRGFEEMQLRWRLDYVFATPDVEVVSAEVITTDLSDHLPVLVKMRM
jgi:endonuclease/exonuclease/phosphatase family metal-dependent hydrolase